MTIVERMLAVMRDVPAIAKERKNASQGFMYRGIDDVYDSMHPLLAKHGILPTQEVLEITRQELPTKAGGVQTRTLVRVRITFTATDGSKIWAESCGEGMDTGDKSAAKAMSAAQKYVYFQTFLVPLNEPEADSESHEIVAKLPVPQAMPASPQGKPAQQVPPASGGQVSESLRNLLKEIGCKSVDEANSVIRLCTSGRHSLGDAQSGASEKCREAIELTLASYMINCRTRQAALPLLYSDAIGNVTT